MKIYDNIREIVKLDRLNRGNYDLVVMAKVIRAIFRDSSFANSPAKINVTEIFKLLAPDAKVKVI